MRFVFTQITHSASFSRVKPTQGEKVFFIWGNELKLTQDESFSFFLSKSVVN